MSSTASILLLAILLLAAIAFYVAAEFALVKSRGFRIRAMVEQDRFGARLLQGMMGNIEAYLACCQLGMISPADAARIERHLASVGLPAHLQDIAGFAQEGLADADSLMALMAQDKKVKRGKLTFILLEAIGRAVIVNDVEPSLVRDFLKTKLAKS
jgi:3-dehydroquinate synthase